MKKIIPLAFCVMVMALGCKGKSEVKTKSSDDKPFGVYQGGIDRAKQVQQQSQQRAASIDSAAKKAAEGQDQ
ncbi:MAG: hypothetical protein QME74_05395 [Candidatus Edwardsbacteria bacterium]|nr:hypothetical protein [Candidatus Edwardsbacteria bacterium]